MANLDRLIDPDGPTTREDVLRFIEIYKRMTAKMPTKMHVPRHTFDAWSAWRTGTKPKPDAGWDDPANRGERLCGLEIVITDYFAME